MARTKRPCDHSTGGRGEKRQRTEAQEKACKLADRLVGAHLEGYLGRKRVYMYEKRRLKQDLQRCLDTFLERLTKRMRDGDETVEFCFEPNYMHYVPTREDVLEALPPELKALEEDVEWPELDASPFTITVTSVGDAGTRNESWAIGIEVDKAYLKGCRVEALNAALKHGEDVEADERSPT